MLVPGLALGRLELVTLLLQILMSCATVYLVYRIALVISRRRAVAGLAALALAIDPLSVLYASKLLTETLFTLCLLVGVYLASRYIEGGSPGLLIAAALPLAASAYVRPISYYLPLLLAATLAVAALVQRKLVMLRLATISAFLALWAVFVVPWQLRNESVAEYPRFSATADINLYFYRAASILARQQNVPFYEMQRRMGYADETAYLASHQEQTTWSKAARFSAMRDEALKIIGNDLGAFARIQLDGMVRVLFDPGATEYLKMFGLYPEAGGLLGALVDHGLAATVQELWANQPVVFWSNLLLIGALGLYYLSAVAGVTSLIRTKTYNLAWALPAVVGVYLALLSGGPAGLNRFRQPIMPLLCLYSGLGAVHVCRRIANRWFPLQSAH